MTYAKKVGKLGSNKTKEIVSIMGIKNGFIKSDMC